MVPVSQVSYMCSNLGGSTEPSFTELSSLPGPAACDGCIGCIAVGLHQAQILVSFFCPSEASVADPPVSFCIVKWPIMLSIVFTCCSAVLDEVISSCISNHFSFYC